MKPTTITLPAFLASALINGDTSSLSTQDEKWLEAAWAYIGSGTVVGCSEEAHFGWHCDLPGFTQGALMLDYTVLYEGPATDEPASPTEGSGFYEDSY